MTKKELIEALEPYDDDMEVYIDDNGTEMYVDKLREEDIVFDGKDILIQT